MVFNTEKKYFKSLQDNIKSGTLREFEIAVKTLLEQYNTTIYENRFIVGGAVEFFILLLLRSVGIPAHAYGEETASGDIILPNNKLLSVKGYFASGKGTIRLVNTMGTATTDWTTATIFVVRNIGLIYGDPTMVIDGDLKRTSDALTLSYKAVERFAGDKNNVIAAAIPTKLPKEMTGFSRKASTAVAQDIISEMKLADLLKQTQENN